MIRINNLQKNFGTKKAVDIENYTIGQGDMLGLVGKTVQARPPSSGLFLTYCRQTGAM